MFLNAQSIKSHIVKETLKLKLQLRQRYYWKNMGFNLLEPPIAVRGMQKLDRNAFQKCVHIPRLLVQEEQLNRVLPLVKKVLLKMENLRPVRTVQADVKQFSEKTALREILLHPHPIKSWDSLPTDELKKLNVDDTKFSFNEIELTYANWRADEILKCVLPLEEEGLTSYSRIGHIVHLNLRDHLLPYKKLIAEVLRDKVPNCRTVVNKAATIDNTYRNFQLELLFGDADYQVETKENGVPFEFDFSKVYWNPRLSTEHERIVQMLEPGDVLYDVFAGVGPFSVPAAKKRCFVMANDLNPDSFRWLQHNIQRNKCKHFAELFNKDGRDFIVEDIKSDLLKRWTEVSSEDSRQYKIHITMNLPAMACEFLDAFRGLFEREAASLKFSSEHFNYPIVHVYTFAKGNETRDLAQSLVEENLGLLLSQNIEGINFVRNVAPNKDMYRVSFNLTEEILSQPIQKLDNDKQLQLSRKRTAVDMGTIENEQSSKVKCA